MEPAGSRRHCFTKRVAESRRKRAQKMEGVVDTKNVFTMFFIFYVYIYSLWIHMPSEKVIGDYVCRLGGPKYLLRRYVDP